MNMMWWRVAVHSKKLKIFTKQVYENLDLTLVSIVQHLLQIGFLMVSNSSFRLVYSTWEPLSLDVWPELLSGICSGLDKHFLLRIL